MSSQENIEIDLIIPEENLEFVSSCALPMPWANFQLHAFVDHVSGKEHLALVLGDVSGPEPVLARVHSECLTGDALFSQRCDCGAQLEAALKRIAKAKRGVVFYLRQEGRGIGLLNKVRAYHLQDGGADTVEANQQLGFPADMRRYTVVLPMLKHLGIQSLRLMTNNPRKVDALEDCGIAVVERLPLVENRNPFNIRYLRTKATKLGHFFPAHDND